MVYNKYIIYDIYHIQWDKVAGEKVNSLFNKIKSNKL